MTEVASTRSALQAIDPPGGADVPKYATTCGGDVDQRDVGTKPSRHVLGVVGTFEVRDLEPFGLEERLECVSKGGVRVDDQHATC
jgi:hypothetical protein